MNGKSKTWALALLVGVLLLGGVAGAAVDRHVIGDATCPSANGSRRSSADRGAGYLDWLSAELSLTPEQRAEVESRIERHRAAVRELWHETRPRFEEMKVQLRNEIREVLNGDQLAAYEELLQRSPERQRHHPEVEKREDGS